MSLIQILLIVDAGLLGLVLIFSLVRFCVVSAKQGKATAEEVATESVAEENEVEEVKEEIAEPAPEETAEAPEEKEENSEYLSDEEEIKIPRIKVMLVEREEVAAPTATAEAPAETAEEQPAEANDEIVEPNEENGLVDVVLVNENGETAEGEDELVIGGTDRFGELKARVPFKEKLLGSEEKVQGYYDEIYNKFISLRKMHARVSAKGVSFRLGRELVAKITYRGKTMKLHLALDVNAFDEKVYFQKDMGDVKAYAEVPFTVKVKSDRALKKALELIDALIAKFEIEAKTRFERVDTIAELKAMD